MALLGIDFGTAAVRAVAVGRDGLPDVASATQVPALVAFGRGRLIAGDSVRMILGARDDALLCDFKRLLGQPPSCPEVRAAGASGGWRAQELHEDLELLAIGGDGQMTPTTLVHATAALLRCIADMTAGEGRHQIVLTVPHWLGPAGRRALSRAAGEAGLDLVRLVQDCVAIGLWVSASGRLRGRIAVVDAGAGGLAVSLLTAGPDTFRVNVSRSDAQLGGIDLDQRMAETASARREPHAQTLLRLACEQIKQELDTTATAKRELMVGPEPVTVETERWELELLIGPLREELAALIGSALEDGQWSPDEIDHLLAAGGMSQQPAMEQSIADAFGRQPVRPEADLNATACGAALALAMAVGQHRGPTVIGDRLASSSTAPGPSAPPPPSSSMMGNPHIRRKHVVRPRPQVKHSRRRPSSKQIAAVPAPQHATNTQSPAPPPSSKQAPSTSAPGTQRSGPAPAHDTAGISSTHASPLSTGAPTPPAPLASTKPSRPSSAPAVAPSGSPTAPASSSSDARALGSSAPGSSSHSSLASDSSAPATPVSSSSGPPGSAASTPTGPRSRSSAPPWRSSSVPSGPTDTASHSTTPPRSTAGDGSSGPAVPLPSEGSIIGIDTATTLLSLAIARPLQARDLEPIHAPVLFRRVLGRANTRGTVHLEGRGYAISFAVEDGSAALSDSAHGKLMRVFDIGAAQWRIEPEVKLSKGLDFYPLRRVALMGLRRVLRPMTADELRAAFGAQLDLAPTLASARRSLPRRLGVSRREQRFIESYLDGTITGRDAVGQGGLGPSTALQVIALLVLFDALQWRQPPPP